MGKRFLPNPMETRSEVETMEPDVQEPGTNPVEENSPDTQMAAMNINKKKRKKHFLTHKVGEKKDFCPHRFLFSSLKTTMH